MNNTDVMGGERVVEVNRNNNLPATTFSSNQSELEAVVVCMAVAVTEFGV
ncbi:hypothetical protein [Dyadobacter sp. CY312]|nr:hypothetical protein [Dyadobacter sp. CY312]MCE7040779.1 hypothetical protein [Dyadobacter sp. CY312]